MAVTTASFVIAFAEFSFVDSALLTAQLAHVEAIVSADVYDTEAKRDYVVQLTLAHALALSPMGRDAGLVAKDGTTTYGAQLKALKLGNACMHESRWGTPPDPLEG